jgi:leucyl-tRNA synthetase
MAVWQRLLLVGLTCEKLDLLEASDLDKDDVSKQVEQIILQNEVIKKWLEGNAPKKIIYVKNKMVNVVI